MPYCEAAIFRKACHDKCLYLYQDAPEYQGQLCFIQRINPHPKKKKNPTVESTPSSMMGRIRQEIEGGSILK
jgi:hypothetical protein